MDILYNSLSHNIRRKIILMIGNHGSVSYTDLTSLNLEPGTLYFHLDILTKANEPLLGRTKDKRYILTDFGQSAYRLILKGDDELRWLFEMREEEGHLRGTIINAFSLTPVMKRIQSDPWRFWLEILLFIGGYGYLSSQVGLLPIFLFFIEIPHDMGSAILATFLAWFVTYLFVELLSMPIFGEKRFTSGLFMSVPLAFLPNVVVELMWYFIPEFSILTGWPLTLILTLTISWSALILTMAIARSKHVQPIRAAIITLIITNANLFLLGLLNNILLSL